MFFDVSGRNLDEAAEIFANTYNTLPITVTPSEKRFWWRLTAVGDTTMSFRKSWGLGRLETESDEPVHDYIVASIESGQMTFEHAGIATATPRDAPFVMFNSSPISKIIGLDVVSNMVHIDQEFVRGVAEELEDADFHDFVLLSPADGRERQNWDATANLVESVLRDNSPITSLLRHEMSRLVAVSMLSNFPYRSTHRVPQPAGIEPSRVSAAIDFMHFNAHMPIGPVEIADSAGLSVRSLNRAIWRYREMSPTILLQRIRLEHIHRELLAGSPTTDSVSASARRWGFIHLGRFSAIYRARFGELPSKTLRS